MSHDPLALLERYAAREGHPRVPKSHIEQGFALGEWVAKRRFAHQQGRFDPERSPRLAALPGWTWNLRDVWDDRWHQVYSLLTTFARREGHAVVRQDCVENGVRLGDWVQKQRQVHKQGRLSAQRVCLLESLPGWSWDPYADSWERHYIKLVSFTERTGHARMPERHVEDGLPLGQWIRAQRRFHRRGKLQEDRASRLEALPGWSWGSERADGLRPNERTSEQPGGRSKSAAEGQDGEWVDAEGASAMCGLSHQTACRLIEDGRLPASRRAGQVQIRRADVAALIESCRIVPESLLRAP